MLLKIGQGRVRVCGGYGCAVEWRMTPDKKRLMWILVAIAFLFANLTVLTLLALGVFSGKH
jgi:hypothetical protein